MNLSLNLLPTVTRLPTRYLCYQGSRPRQFSRKKSCRFRRKKLPFPPPKPKHKTPSNHASTSGVTLARVVRLSGTGVLAMLALAVLTPLDLVVLAALAILEGNAAVTLMYLLHLLFLTLSSLLHLLHLVCRYRRRRRRRDRRRSKFEFSAQQSQ